MAGGDGDTALRIKCLRHQEDSRCRTESNVNDAAPGGEQAGKHRVLNHRPRGPRISPNHHCSTGDKRAERHSELRDEPRVQRNAYLSANA